MLSLAAARRMSVAISRSMMTVCLTRRSHSQMPTMHSTVSALRKILSIRGVDFSGGVRRRTQRGQRPARAGADLQLVVLAAGQPAIASVRDHRRVVRTELRPRIEDLQARAPAERGELAAQVLIGTDAACDDERRHSGLSRSARALRDQRFYDGLLKLARHVGTRLLIELHVARRDDHCGFQ